MKDVYENLIKIAAIYGGSDIEWTGIYANLRKVLETHIRERLGEEKYNALPKEKQLHIGVENFCYEIGLGPNYKHALMALKNRANKFIHANRPANGDYFLADLKTLCEVFSKSINKEVPNELKQLYEKDAIKQHEKMTQKDILKSADNDSERNESKMDSSRFEKYSPIADEETRKKIAEQTLINVSDIGTPIETNNIEGDKYANVINEILEEEIIYDVTYNNPEVAEKITDEILNFITRTKRVVDRTESPFIEEFEKFKLFQEVNEDSYKNEWGDTRSLLESIYNKDVFDTSFYDKEFEESSSINKNNEHRPSFKSVKAHFLNKWEELLTSKQLKFELDIIEQERKVFVEQLYNQIENLKKLQEALEPFTNELGRLWDMSKGNWQKVNFDLLKRYGELLQKDKSITELSEMLGKMRNAEKEFEEELFANIRLNPEWKVEHASKSDLIGIHESDDLSSLVPSEIALLADPTLQTIFFKKFTEKKLQTFEYQAKMLSSREEEYEDKRQKEKEDAKGPFIICVDTSGSMHGTPETVAKMLCFAILKIAIRDHRKCYLISFSTGIQTLNLSDLKNSLEKLLEFLSMSFHGGTDATQAMKEALKMLGTEDYKKADVLMISDFVMPGFDSTMRTQIKAAKENKTKFHSLVVGNSQNPATIKDFDSNWFYDLNNPNSVLTLIKNINEL